MCYISLPWSKAVEKGKIQKHNPSDFKQAENRKWTPMGRQKGMEDLRYGIEWL
jgi:hypothetical protein